MNNAAYPTVANDEVKITGKKTDFSTTLSFANLEVIYCN